MAKARLGSTYEALSGRLGNTVASNVQDGTEIRSHNPVSKQPFTDAQLAREAAFTEANQAWTTIGRPAATEWRAWGRTQKVRNELTGKYRTREGKDCFVGQFSKLLQMSAAAAIPTPPTEGFVKDNVVLLVELGGGTADFSASKANRAGVTMEIMAQRLPSAVALPAPDGYRTVAFHAFAAGDLTFSTPLAPGYWAISAQSVEIATGRVAGFQLLGVGKVTLSMVQGDLDEATEGLKQAA